MDGPSPKKSDSLETLVIQNISNISELKAKLNDIVNVGRDYDYDVSSCLKSLLKSSDQEIVLLTVQAIAELSKCENKRETYAQNEVIEPLLSVLRRGVTPDRLELFKQCCRALGNLCCDCDTGRKLILENNGISTLTNLLQKSINDTSGKMNSIKLFTSKTLLNFSIGGVEMTEEAIKEGVIDLMLKILRSELENDDMVSTALLVLSVVNDNIPEYLFSDEVNSMVLQILKETSNIDISEVCLDHLHMQADHDSVKTLIAKDGGVQLVCSRLELLAGRHTLNDDDDGNADKSKVDAIIEAACDFITIILTGDDAMNLLYDDGAGEVYRTMVGWLDSIHHTLLATAVLTIGNFARQDDHCVQMMDSGIFNKLLDVFEVMQNFNLQAQQEPSVSLPVPESTITKVQHGVLSTLRNLLIPTANKRIAAKEGRAATLLIEALPTVQQYNVVYKLLAAIRMLVDGQESVARQLASHCAGMAAVAGWGRGGQCAGAGGEAPRLIAWTVRALRDTRTRRQIVQVDGCVSSLVNMLVAPHAIMQNEALLALTLLAFETLTKNPSIPEQNGDFDHEKSFITQLIQSEIGKHVAVLLETNYAKIPVEVAENLVAFLDLTSQKNELMADYNENNVHVFLLKLLNERVDLNESLTICLKGALAKIGKNSTD